VCLLFLCALALLLGSQEAHPACRKSFFSNSQKFTCDMQFNPY